MTPRLSKQLLVVLLGAAALVFPAFSQPLPGTAPLEMDGDIASNLVAGADRFLLRKLDQSESGRAQYWHRDFSSAETYDQRPGHLRFPAEKTAVAAAMTDGQYQLAGGGNARFISAKR